ncbi:MAG: FAD-dependent oxidoreductase [Anaerolineaceae bacterium]|nr:FAD-dependent oxidoreductase [Anaerolineaceae bacterium]MBN2677906.1 FAD-dependent oxidoreductase [Anaerolineaceae bacterium]
MTEQHHVAVVGAGPAGLFGSRRLTEVGFAVTLFNRDIKPGGLAEYGIYPDKTKIKNGLRSQFQTILANEKIDYLGNVRIGENRDLRLSDLFQQGYDAVLVTAGAQGVKKLGLPGEETKGIYHAKDVVYHYNQLPPYSMMDYQIGRHVAVIGAGNVMVDIARWLVDKQGLDDVNVLVRRGPGEVKFDRMELAFIAHYIDLDALDKELKRVSTITTVLGQAPTALLDMVKSCIKPENAGKTRPAIRFYFLTSPSEFSGGEDGWLCRIKVENNTLVESQGKIKSHGLGTFSMLEVDNLVFAIGDAVDEELGLPARNYEYMVTETPRYPIEGLNYEVDGSDVGLPSTGIFIAGWSRQSSYGLVGQARKDGLNGAEVVIKHLEHVRPNSAFSTPIIRRADVVNKQDVSNLVKRECEMAAQLGLESFKYKSNEEMLSAIR